MTLDELQNLLNLTSNGRPWSIEAEFLAEMRIALPKFRRLYAVAVEAINADVSWVGDENTATFDELCDAVADVERVG